MDYLMAVITDGRRECITRTIGSAEVNLPEPTRRLIINDSDDEDYEEFLIENFWKWDIYTLKPKAGFSGAIQALWEEVLRDTIEWVFHLEDDFVINYKVPLVAMQRALSENRHLAQMALKRGPWSRQEHEAGGICEQHPDEYVNRGTALRWTEHRRFFTTNPSLYHRRICEIGWPDAPGSEGAFSERLFSNPNMHSSFLGEKFSPPWVDHIGAERIGHGY